ncbi:hypothetical protein [Nostoc sp.]|uniref:hypothetical protein n=1 Tax=Nostoc sp. TaxID=1180 RepID=UPI002FF62AB2
MLLYPVDQARAVFRQFNEFVATAPDELTVTEHLTGTGTIRFQRGIYWSPR